MLLALTGAPPLAAAEPAVEPSIADLDHDFLVDGVIVGAAATTWLTLELFQSEIAPASCRWCQPNALDSGARDALRWRSRDAAHQLSSVTAYGLAPLTVLGLSAWGAGHGGGGRRILVDTLIVSEAVALAAVLGQVVKLAAARRRPFVTSGMPAADPDRNLSFYSGHTAFAFSVAAAAATVAMQRGYRTAPWVALAGAVLATFTGYLRIAADRHYLTDVLAGAVVGTGAGIGIPLLLHPVSDRMRSRRVWLVPTPGGAALLGTF